MFFWKRRSLPCRHSQPYITSGLFHQKTTEFCELRLKAWNSRIMTAFLTTCLTALVSSLPVSDRSVELALTTGAMVSISSWMLKLEGCGRYLSGEEAEMLWDEGNKFLAINELSLMLFSFVHAAWPINIEKWFTILGSSFQLRFLELYRSAAHAFVAQGRLFLPMRPKTHVSILCFNVFMCFFSSGPCLFWSFFSKLCWFHQIQAFQELCYEMRANRLNARMYHGYMDEDAVGSVKALCRRTHRSLLEFRVMGRLLIGLKASSGSRCTWEMKKTRACAAGPGALC